MQTENLSIGYVKNKVPHELFEGLNLHMERGKLVCFMGPNGIGKSTLIRTLAGLHPPLNGKLTPQNEKTVALVLTEQVTATKMTARELVSYGRYPYLNWVARLSYHDQEKIDQSLQQLHIADLADKKISELSDGQMQMVMIARALAQETPLLLLDEPTAHLDLNNRVAIMKLLKKLARDTHKAVLVATHELDLALQTADVVWLATPNKAIVAGMPEDLVLSGAFDEVFQLKGFDLKTGKVFHEQYQNKNVQLVGDGPTFLWTKNALERNGFCVTSDSGLEVVIKKDPMLAWQANGEEFSKLEGLITHLEAVLI
jgi:iron complex transport system ATP-binding protein